MKCEKCGAEWTAGKQFLAIEKCPFCNASLIPEPENNEDTEFSDALKQIFERTGSEILQDSRKVNAWFADIAPNLKTEQKILSHAIPEIGNNFANCPPEQQEANIRKSVRALDGLLAESAIRSVISALVTALEWDENLIPAVFPDEEEKHSPELDFTVKKISIFSSDNGKSKDESAVFGKVFNRSAVKKIGVRVYFDPQPYERTISLHWEIYDQTKKLIKEKECEILLHENSTWCANSWGWDEAGKWKAGNYSVMVRCNNGKIHLDTFTIQDDALMEIVSASVFASDTGRSKDPSAVFGDVFQKERTKKIGIRVYFRPQSQERDIVLHWGIYDENGNLYSPVRDTKIHTLPNDRWIADGWGFADAGKWQAGKYKIIAHLDGGQESVFPFEIQANEQLYNITKLNIFASDNGKSSDKSAVFNTTFERIGLKYIGIRVYIPPQNYDRDVTLKWRIYSEDGLTDSKPIETVVHMQANSSWIANGWGWKDAGKWKAGTYKIVACVNDASPVTKWFHIIDADVITRTEIFSSDSGKVFDKSTVFGTAFERSTTRHIGIRAYIPPRNYERDVILKWAIYRADGTLYSKQMQTPLHVLKNSDWITVGWGWKDAGKWLVGKYKIVAQIGDSKESVCNFEITDSKPVEITKLDVFNSPDGRLQNLKFGKIFSMAEAHYIGIRAHILPVPYERDMTLYWQVYNENYVPVMKKLSVFVHFGANSDWCLHSWGFDEAGRWKAGSYHIVAHFEGGNEFATTFIIK